MCGSWRAQVEASARLQHAVDSCVGVVSRFTTQIQMLDKAIESNPEANAQAMRPRVC